MFITINKSSFVSNSKHGFFLKTLLYEKCILERTISTTRTQYENIALYVKINTKQFGQGIKSGTKNIFRYIRYTV